MKIKSVSTFVHDDFPNIVHVEIEADNGIIGLGESYYFGSTVAHYINAFAGPAIIGMNPLEREAILKTLTSYVGYNSSGVETRARSAIDLALWDIAAKSENKPLYKYLGATDSRALRIYNTCAGKLYMRKSNQNSSAWGLDSNSDQYEDLKAFMNDAGTLAEELLSEGISAMKIWPFDLYAEKNWGSEISMSDLKSGLIPITKIRDKVGGKMDIMIELHALWSLKAAKEIMSALKDFDIFWVEDPLHPDLSQEFEELRIQDFPKIAHGETVASYAKVQYLTKNKLIDYLTLDLGWCGGLTQGLQYAEAARLNGINIAPHDCTGPVGLIFGAHLSTFDPNAVIQETVRSSMRTWYPHIVNGLPSIDKGFIMVTENIGHGLSLTDEFRNSPNMRSFHITEKI